jgi:aerobic carbon-monoxide dehydrogenase small subunit
MMKSVSLRVNGVAVTKSVAPRTHLADFLREELHLTGTHIGCEHGVCGACTVVWNGEIARSCLAFAVQANGAEIATVESLAHGDQLHPIQQAFWDHHALQCGFCTPGFLMTVWAFLRENPSPTPEQIRIAIAGNLCRCTGYQNIVEAITAAAAAMQAGNPS